MKRVSSLSFSKFIHRLNLSFSFFSVWARPSGIDSLAFFDVILTFQINNNIIIK